MSIKTKPQDVFEEYQRGVYYNESLHIFDQVQTNEDFFIGDQWKGVDAPDMDKPVVNILKRPVNYLIASIVSDDIGISLAGWMSGGEEPDAGEKAVLDMLEAQLAEVMELAAFKKRLRLFLRDACVDGDGCLHFYWDPDAGPLRPIEGVGELKGVRGAIQAEVIANTDVYFGNTESSDVQKQPWIIIRYRRGVEELREWAKEHGVREAESIREDDSDRHNSTNNEHEGSKATVLRKYWKKNGDVQYTEVTADTVLIPPQNTGYRRYPLVWMPWEQIKNRYHGQAVITGMLNNQLYRNKLLAMMHRHVYMMAFPKVVYNADMLDEWDNTVGAAIAVHGDPNQAIATGFRAPDMSAQVLQVAATLKNDTVEAVGASDAALGNVKPNNTSAIIATQKATAVPLELQRMAFYDAVEDSVRIWLDMMGALYGVRTVRIRSTAEPELAPEEQLAGIEPQKVELMVAERFDFAQLQDMDLRLNVEVGAASYWSELTQTATLSNLFSAGALDAETYLKYLPDGALAQKQSIIDDLKRKAAKPPEKPTADSPVMPQDAAGQLDNLRNMMLG